MIWWINISHCVSSLNLENKRIGELQLHRKIKLGHCAIICSPFVVNVGLLCVNYHFSTSFNGGYVFIDRPKITLIHTLYAIYKILGVGRKEGLSKQLNTRLNVLIYQINRLILKHIDFWFPTNMKSVKMLRKGPELLRSNISRNLYILMCILGSYQNTAGSTKHNCAGDWWKFTISSNAPNWI